MTPEPFEQDRLAPGNVNRVGLVVGQPFYWQSNRDEVWKSAVSARIRPDAMRICGQVP